MIQEVVKPKPPKLNQVAAFTIGSMVSAIALRWPELKSHLIQKITTLAADLEADDHQTMQASEISRRLWPGGSDAEGYLDGLIHTAVVQCLNHCHRDKQCMVDDLKTIATDLAMREG
jgi:hypothetical protein